MVKLLLATSCLLLLSPADEGVGHDAQLLDLSALLLRQILHGLLGVEAGPGGAVAVNLPLVLPGLERALKGLVGKQTAGCERCRSASTLTALVPTKCFLSHRNLNIRRNDVRY